MSPKEQWRAHQTKTQEQTEHIEAELTPGLSRPLSARDAGADADGLLDAVGAPGDRSVGKAQDGM